jgi:hypothetical protein
MSRSQLACALTGKPPFTPRAQDGDGGRHAISIQGNRGERIARGKEKRV